MTRARLTPRVGRVAMWLAALAVAAYLLAGQHAQQQDLRSLALQNRHDVVVTTGALCALRRDLETRVRTSRDFIAKNPKGVAGIPVQTIKDGIINQQRTITALRGIQCPKAD